MPLASLTGGGLSGGYSSSSKADSGGNIFEGITFADKDSTKKLLILGAVIVVSIFIYKKVK